MIVHPGARTESGGRDVLVGVREYDRGHPSLSSDIEAVMWQHMAY